MKNIMPALICLGAIAVASFMPAMKPAETTGAAPLIGTGTTVAPSVSKPPAKPAYTYSTRRVCAGDRCYYQQVATVEGYSNGVYVKNASGGWTWEGGSNASYEVSDGPSYEACEDCSSGAGGPLFGAALPGQPVRRAAKVAKAGGRVAFRAVRAPVKFFRNGGLFRRGGC